VFLTNLENSVDLSTDTELIELANKLNGVSNSMTYPSLTTITLS